MQGGDGVVYGECLGGVVWGIGEGVRWGEGLPLAYCENAKS